MRKLVLVIFLSLSAGCAGVNWSERAGDYTLNDARMDYGPPDNCDSVETGQVCAWTTSIGRNWVDKLILSFDQKGVLISGGERRF